MAPARALALVALLCAAASAAGGAPVPKRIPTPEEVALSSAARAYQIALERYNGHAVISGSIQDEEAVRLHAAKEEARRAMIRAEKAAGMKHATIAPRTAPSSRPRRFLNGRRSSPFPRCRPPVGAHS